MLYIAECDDGTATVKVTFLGEEAASFIGVVGLYADFMVL
jgi:hypothetical protein